MYDRDPERAGAYDFLENPQVTAEAVARPMFEATARRAAGDECVFVAIDGSSLTLSDTTGSKKLGPISNTKAPARGLKVMNAVAVSRVGVPLGLIDQIFWSRAETLTGLTQVERTMRSQRRPFEEKEAANFVRAALHARERLQKEGVRPWFIIDREGDNRDLLLRMHELDCAFTIRGHWDRGLFDDKRSIHEVLDDEPSLGRHEVDVSRNGRRAARQVTVDVRAALVTLLFPRRVGLPTERLRLYAVRVREVSEDKKGIEWLLLTNVPTRTAQDARVIIESYRARWRIEEFHRTWKQGGCNVEDAQLRSIKAIQIWATLLAAVAMRIERLKYLSRSHPDELASVELTDEELEALALDQRQRGKAARDRASTKMPTINLATCWLAELGGWLGAKNGPPGSIVLARGLERLGYLVDGIALARSEPVARKGRRT